jgi:hypothetical protein
LVPGQESEVLTFLIYLLIKKSVLIVTILGGVGFAVYRWKRYPRISLMTVLALGLYLVDTLAFVIITSLLPRFFFQLHLTAQNISTLSSVFQLLDDFVFATVVILLVAAAFTGRVRESVTIDQRTDQ